MRHLDLFSGIGGFALAARRVWGEQHEIVAFCEIDPFCQKVLQKNFPNNEYIHGDIKTFKCSGYAPVDLLTAGFPCQPFSIAGRRKGAADDRALWYEALRIIKKTRPTWIVAENVTGIVSMELDSVCASLEDAGYTVETYNIPACAVNAPHRRERVWIIANTDRTIQARIAANANGAGLQGQHTGECSGGQSETETGWGNAGAWHEIATRVCGVDARVPRRMDRLRALGNAIVPQVAQEIFRAIQVVETA
jgi:DNA (cytosine-5)-methyltransferase 1